MYFAQLLILGLLAGAVLSLVAIGFTLVLGVGKIANFAHGAFVAVAGISIPWTELVAAIFTFLVAGGLHVLIRVSRWGRALRATAEDPVVAGLCGIRVPIMQRAAVTLSIVVAGLAGVIIAPFTVLTPSAGTTYLISAFAVVVLGGIGSTAGAVVAGLVIGVADSMAAGYLSSYWTTLAPLLIILGYLLIRPGRVTA